MRAINFIALLFVVAGIIGWYQSPAQSIMEQIYLMCTLMASVITPYIIVKLYDGAFGGSNERKDSSDN